MMNVSAGEVRVDEEVPVTTTTRPVARPGMPPASTAQLALGAVLVAHLAIVEITFLNAGTGKNSVLTVAKFFGLHAATLMMLQLVLVARLPWLDRRLGMDRLTRWHRWVGFTLFWTVLTHATLIVLGYARLDNAPVLKTFLGLAGVVASLLGMLAATVIVLIGATSARFLRRRLSYEAWHALHMGVYLAILLALFHQALEGTTFTSSPLAAAHWWTVWALVLGSLLVGRVVIPLRRNARHAFRVAAVVPESRNVTSVYVTGRDLTGCPRARASSASGGSATTTAGGRPTRSRSRPRRTGVAAAHRQGRRRDQRRAARPPGRQRVFVEGPYGAFTALHQTTPGLLLIAGGVGVTPVRALLEERPARRSCSTACRTWRRPCCCASCRTWPGARVRCCTCWPGAPGRGTRRSRRSTRSSSPRWCPTSPAATCSSAAHRP